MLDRLDKFIEHTLIPAYTSGRRRKTYPPYVAITMAAWKARKVGNLDAARLLSQQAQTMPSRDPNDPNFRRLRYTRYADDFLLGFTGPKAEANDIKGMIAEFLRDELRLELSEDKTLITNARSESAHFLGYEIHTLHADDKHDYRGQRCINGGIGLRVPAHVIKEHCAKYMRHSKPIHMAQRINDSVYSIIAQYQIEYCGVVQYYRMGYNLHRFQWLKRVMEESLAKTLASKLKTTRSKIYKQFGKIHENEYGVYKVLEAVVDRGPDKEPLVARFGGIPLQWNKWVAIGDALTEPIWSSGRSEVIERLLAQECELCGARSGIEVHHIRKLADLERRGRDEHKWMRVMAARRRKTLVVCQSCHNSIHYGRYDGTSLSKQVTGELCEMESAHA